MNLHVPRLHYFAVNSRTMAKLRNGGADSACATNSKPVPRRVAEAATRRVRTLAWPSGASREPVSAAFAPAEPSKQPHDAVVSRSQWRRTRRARRGALSGRSPERALVNDGNHSRGRGTPRSGIEHSGSTPPRPVLTMLIHRTRSRGERPAYSERDMSEETNAVVDWGRDVVVQGNSAAFTQSIDVAGHKLVADEPPSLGGADLGPGPHELLLAALGSCTSITVTMYARRKKWPLEGVKVWLRRRKLDAKDCADCESKEGSVTEIVREIELTGPLDADQKSRLLDIANKCPVHKTLTSEVKIRSRIVG
jgi:putative redox protein